MDLSYKKDYLSYDNIDCIIPTRITSSLEKLYMLRYNMEYKWIGIKLVHKFMPSILYFNFY